MGFLSRFIVFSYSYSISTVTEILSYYSEHGLNLEGAEVKLPEKEVDIKLPKKIAEELNPIAMAIGKQFELYGFRAKINFRSLLKCLAYRNGRNVVSEDDFKEFLELADFMNFDFNPI